MLDKPKVIEAFRNQILQQLKTLESLVSSAHSEATHPENKAENKYDTRGLEASYLAGAQSKRALEMNELFVLFKQTTFRKFTAHDPVAASALLELENESGSSFYLLMPKGGGLSVTLDKITIHCITPSSPVGKAVLGKKQGDDIEFSFQNQIRDYNIVSVR